MNSCVILTGPQEVSADGNCMEWLGRLRIWLK